MLPANLISNPSGELSTVGWSSPSTVVTDTDAIAGSHMIECTGSIPAGNTTFAVSVGATGVGTGKSGVPVTPSASYSARGRGKLASATTTLSSTWGLYVYWYKPDGSAASVSRTTAAIRSAVLSLPTDFAGVVGPPPPDAAFAAVRFVGGISAAQGTTQTIVVRGDAVMLATVDTGATAVPAYGDGDSPGWAWGGAPHASPSAARTPPTLTHPLRAGLDSHYTRAVIDA